MFLCLFEMSNLRNIDENLVDVVQLINQILQLIQLQVILTVEQIEIYEIYLGFSNEVDGIIQQVINV